MLLFNQLLKDLDCIYRDVGGYDVSYDKFKQFLEKISRKGKSYLCIERSKKRDQRRYCICNENKNTSIICTLETKPF